MNTLRKNSEIAFCGASYEFVSQRLFNGIKKLDYSNEFYCDYEQMNSSYYNMLFRKLGMGFSQEEIHNLYIEMKQQTKTLKDIPPSLFQLLVLYGKQALVLRNGRPLCRREAVLGWRSTSLRMGQDIFTTAFLAYKKAAFSLSGNIRFDYPALINTDDSRLDFLLRKGIAENHFHLTGSTRQFPLSWIFLMNNPNKIAGFFKNNNRFFKTNRNRQIILSDNETIMPISDKLLRAAWIRAKLFMRLNGNDDGKNLLFELSESTFYPGEKSRLYNDVMSLRLLYGVAFEQLNGKKACLDYAIKKDSFDIDIHSYNRLLWGEREFMFDCFNKSFKGEFSEDDQNLFYLYLLIKSQFRAEMVQINQEVGFANFSEYQDRKDIFWGDENEYLAEAQRLAVCATLESGCIKSLEMRLPPKKTCKNNYRSVLTEDEYVYYAEDKKSNIMDHTFLARLYENKKIDISKDFPFFYVTHFIKKKQCDEKEMPVFGIIKPRNYETREMAKKCAVALSIALEKSNYLCSRIRGIDAASFEIGCRPEVFATAFRYLRNFSPNRNTGNGFVPTTQVRPLLGVTYHVGEDFLDIADGLRAIDEAVRFLDMKRGDRIGHALALGVDPNEHYNKKNRIIALPKQDMLDNMVWLLKRSSEFGIDIHKIRPLLQDKANYLLREIYGECINRNKWNVNLDDYYSSWMLRGDNPKIYVNPYNAKSFDRHDIFSGSGASVEQYKCYYINDSDLDEYRNQESVRGLLYYYHFGYMERKIGAEIYTMEISDSYIEFVSAFQKKMQSFISNAGIAIECNLSSNQLIGTFSNYEKHPIFTFNDHIISDNKSGNKLSVSINTDDQGIFDTSLENEYAILVECMAQMKNDGKRKYNDDIIFDYIDHIREMGLNQVFPKSGID